MDFFESQDIARRNTRFLLFLFVLAVISLVLLTNGLLYLLLYFQTPTNMLGLPPSYTWEMFAVVSAGVVTIIGIASLIRLHILKKGGAVIAEMMDGELITEHGGDYQKRVLLNVVQEMAIASGTPVPPVYLIHENAINAFAAGYSPGDAVIGITRGALDSLNRDQLQGVIAHEFSHILNGDMRLNSRLMGVLFGILMLYLIGRTILSPGRGSSGSGRGNSHAAISALGAGLMIIGSVGQFFGNLIKAAVSRQREFLADASAVQFTRNPDGIAGALKRIGGYSGGSVLEHPESEELSHAFFSEGVSFTFSNIMATHPPLQERIKRIEPYWDGAFIEHQEIASESESAVMGFAAGAASSTGEAIDAEAVETAVDHVGNPQATELDRARQILAAIPDAITEAAGEPYSARALVYLLLLDNKAEVRDTQLKHLREAADLGVYDALQKLMAHPIQPAHRIPVLELAYPALRQLSYEQYRLFMTNVDTLIRADNKVGLSEWAVQKMVSKHLAEVFEGQHAEPTYSKLSMVRPHCAVLLSILSHADRKASIPADEAFKAGQAALEENVELLEKSELSFKKLNEALDTLANLHPLRKPKLIKACVKTITADGKVTQVEAELIRTIADTLDCPMPPLAA